MFSLKPVDDQSRLRVAGLIAGPWAFSANNSKALYIRALRGQSFDKVITSEKNSAHGSKSTAILSDFVSLLFQPIVSLSRGLPFNTL